jgi:hypothetical protein
MVKMKIERPVSEKREAYLSGRSLLKTGKSPPPEPADSDKSSLTYWKWYGFQIGNSLEANELTQVIYVSDGRRV